MARSRSIVAAVLAVCATMAHAEGDAWRALAQAQPADAAALAPAWREALTRMSREQLDALRRGEPASAIALDGGGTLADFLAERGVVGMPASVAVAPLGGGRSEGGTFAIAGALSTGGNDVPNGSLTGGTLRLDPLLPGGGGTSTSATPSFRIDASVGQATVARANSTQTTLQSGFWTATDATALDRVFRDGFE